jgi:hypothetical protein
MLQTKIDKMQYTTLDQFKADVELMVSNAKKYNVKESYAYQDANKIQASIPKNKHIILQVPDYSLTRVLSDVETDQRKIYRIKISKSG